MRPISIPDWAREQYPEVPTRVITGPSGLLDPDIAPIEVQIDQTKFGPVIFVYCILENDDLEKFQAGGLLRLGFIANHLDPFNLEVVNADSGTEPRPS